MLCASLIIFYLCMCVKCMCATWIGMKMYKDKARKKIQTFYQHIISMHMNKFMRNDNASTRQKQTHFFIWSISIRHAKKQIRVYALFFSFFFCSEIKFSNNYQAFQRWKRGQKSNETIFMAKITWLKYFKNTLNSNMMVYLRSFHFCQFPCICMCLAFFFFAEFLNSKKMKKYV